MSMSDSLYADIPNSGKEQGLFGGLLMNDIYQKVLLLAKTEFPVIFEGETGSGKHCLARVLHDNSNRSAGPLHFFYCPGIDESTWKDAFRENVSVCDDKIVIQFKAIEKAAGGTLVLYRFCELAEDEQSRILMLFLEGIRYVFRYANQMAPRLVLAMQPPAFQKMCKTAVWKNTMKSLLPVVVTVPPLRQYKQDIPLLIDFFLREIHQDSARGAKLGISETALRACCDYNWPGNIRQLKNALIQGATLSGGNTIELIHLPFSISWKLPYLTHDLHLKKPDNRNNPQEMP